MLKLCLFPNLFNKNIRSFQQVILIHITILHITILYWQLWWKEELVFIIYLMTWSIIKLARGILADNYLDLYYKHFFWILYKETSSTQFCQNTAEYAVFFPPWFYSIIFQYKTTIKWASMTDN